MPLSSLSAIFKFCTTNQLFKTETMLVCLLQKFAGWECVPTGLPVIPLLRLKCLCNIISGLLAAKSDIRALVGRIAQSLSAFDFRFSGIGAPTEPESKYCAINLSGVVAAATFVFVAASRERAVYPAAMAASLVS